MRLLLFSLLIAVSSQAFCKQLVLIQGYLGQPSSWSDSGIAQQLDNNGWDYAGEFVYASDGARLLAPDFSRNHQPSIHKFYRVSLPTEASIQNQAFYLTSYVKKLREYYPQQEIILVGHSAGGVLARYVMVRKPELNIHMLITIASPHLGTDSAELGQLIGNSPLAFIAPIVGASTINRSQGLYSDLLPEMPHRFLYWLNRQPHPDAEYISIVRDQQSPDGGDFIVSQRSQFLENVYSLRYRATSYVVQGSHGLTFADGVILLDLLNERSLPRLSDNISILQPAITI
ncbi:MAG: alpha/beta fold hydrolase [Gammaproteobacteria bacterium]|nr:alpha/beta fold hydrolase [Gammaproteobacteria bacterium]